jgi:hypothetical protein
MVERRGPGGVKGVNRALFPGLENAAFLSRQGRHVMEERQQAAKEGYLKRKWTPCLTQQALLADYRSMFVTGLTHSTTLRRFSGLEKES